MGNDFFPIQRLLCYNMQPDPGTQKEYA